MKLSYCCPKCNCSNIAMIPHSSFGGDIYTDISVGFTTIHIIKYICTDCGYVENYIDDPKGLGKIKDKYLRSDQNDGFV